MVPPKVNKIGKYEVLDVIGRGGMGTVYKAIDPTIGRVVAIKKVTAVLSDDPDLLKRFYREAQSTGKLQHPNIVTLHDLGDQDGVPYLVMEYLEGDSLEKVIKEHRPYSLAEKLNIIIQVCEGLGYAHQREIIHRDVKPGNVVILKDGGVKIVDFGIAQLGNERFTRTGQVVGSLYYMSPEQIQGADIDARSDIYSAGVVLFEFLCDVLPFQGKDPTSTLAKILHDPPPSLKGFLTSYPPELDTVVQQALAKDRNNRYSSMEDFAFDLQSVQEKLSQDLIAGYLRTAEFCLATKDWDKAREHLRQILKFDKQNRRANELLREVQRQIQEQQIGEQVRQLRTHAGDALGARRWDEALALLDQAVRLDGKNSELIEFRNSVRRSSKLLAEALRKAESAHNEGDLDTAKRAVEEALSVDPADTTAKALNAILSKEIAERSKRKKIDEFVTEARKEIALRHYTSALDLLQQAEGVDPSVGEVHQLMRSATAGREHERRRRALEEAGTEIEDLLNRDEYSLACSKADQAIQKFPEDLGLLKLRSFAEKQRDAWARRLFIEAQINTARQLLDAGQLVRAHGILNEALERYPDDSGMISLLSIVTEGIARQEAQRKESERQAAEKRRYINLQISAAAELQRYGQTAQALAKLRDALQHYPDSEELRSQLIAAEDQLAREEDQRKRAEQEARRRREEVEKEIAASRQLLGSRQTGRALVVLQQALQRFPESEELKSELEFTQRRLAVELAERERAEQEARRRLADIEIEIGKALQLMNSGQASQAVASLEQAFSRYPDSEPLKTQLELAQRRLALEQAERERTQQERRRRDAEIEKEIGAAQQLFESNQAGRALAALEQALRRYPEDEKLKSKYEFVQQRIAVEKSKQEQEARRRQIWIDSEITVTRELLDSKQASKAVAALEQVIRQFPDSEELKAQLELARRRLAIEQAERQRAELEARLKQEEIDREIASAWQLLDNQQTSQAAASLEQAVRRFPESKELKSQLELAKQRLEVEEAERERLRQEELSRRTEIEKEIAGALRLLDSKQADRAISALEQALYRYPDSDELKSRLEDARRRLVAEQAERERAELEARRRRADIDKEIASARQLLDAKQTTQAVTSLEQAVRRFPESTELRSQLEVAKKLAAEEAERERLRQEELRRRAEIEKAIASSRQLLDARQITQAMTSLEPAVRRFPESTELKSQLELAKQLAAEEAERERLRQEELRKRTEIEKAIATAVQFLDSKQADRAVSTLEPALRRYPDSGELKSKLEDARRQQVIEQAERQRAELEARLKQEEIDKEIATARQLLDSKQTSQAVETLQQAVRRFPENKELKSQLELASQRLARERDEQARAEEQAARRSKEIESQITAARRLLQSNQTLKAVEAMEQALQKFPESEALRSELAGAQQRLKQERAEREKAEREARARQERIGAEIAEATRLLKANQTSKACELLESAVQRYPESEELRSQLAASKKRLAQEQADREEAEKRRARLEGETIRAQMLLKSGKPDEAVQALEASLKSLGKSTQLQSLLETAKAEVKQKKEDERKRIEAERQAEEQKLRRDRELAGLRKLADPVPASAKVAVLEKRIHQAQEIAGRYASDSEFQDTLANVRRVVQAAIDIRREREAEQAQARLATKVSATAASQGQAAVVHEPGEAASHAVSKPETERKLPELSRRWIIAAAIGLVLVVGAVVVKVVSPSKTYTVHIETQPAGATVRVGKQTCVSPNCQLSLPAGHYQVDVQLQGYEPRTQEFWVEAQQAQPTVTVDLVSPPPPPPPPAGNSGYLVVKTGVDGAEVLINGQKSDKLTVAGVLRLPVDPGDYSVEVQKNGYSPVKPSRVRVRKNEEKTLSFNLTILPTRAGLVISGAKANVKVLVDGQDLGLTASDGSFSHDLSQGDHEITLVQNGHNSNSIHGAFLAGKERRIEGKDFRFLEAPPSPAPPSARIADVSVKNLPPGASVKVDGRDTHQADNSGIAHFQIPAGNHTLELTKDNFRTRTFAQQSFSAGQTSLDGHMDPAAVPVDVEATQWTNLGSSNDMGALQEFMSKFPNGSHSAQAQSRLEKLIGDNQNVSELEGFSKKFPGTSGGTLAGKKAEGLRSLDQDKRDIQNLMDRYKAAYDHLDLKALAAVYPSFSNQKGTKSKFENAKTATMVLRTEQLKIDGDQASIKVTQSVTWKEKDGSESGEDSPQLTFVLVKKGGQWLIQKGT